MGLGKTFDRATATDSTGRTLDRVDLAGGPQQVRAAQRDLIAIEQRDETNRLLAEQNDLLRQLLARG